MPANQFIFPKSCRLTQSAEFAQVKKNGRVYRGRSVLLSILRANDATRFRAGFITSRALGPAVARNRVRRSLRAIVRKHQREIVEGLFILNMCAPCVQLAVS